MRATTSVLLRVDVRYDCDRNSQHEAQQALLESLPERCGVATVHYAAIVGGLVDADDVPQKESDVTAALRKALRYIEDFATDDGETYSEHATETMDALKMAIAAVTPKKR